MSRTTRRGKSERDHRYDKNVGTGSYQRINKGRKAKHAKRMAKQGQSTIMNALQQSEKQDYVTLSPSEMTEVLVGVYQAGCFQRTPMLLGAPGIGKTVCVHDAVEKLREIHGADFFYKEIHPTMPPEELAGIPDLIRKEGAMTRTDYAMPSWFPRKEDDPDLKGIICFDDMAQANKEMQTNIANCIQARNIRGHELPDGIMIIGTGNRAEDNAGSGKLLSHLADRMTPFYIEACPQQWIKNFAIPKGVDPRIISFIQSHPDRLNMFNPKASKSPTSRTWTALSGRMAYIDSLKDTPLFSKVSQAIICGELGMANGSLFYQHFTAETVMPDLDLVIANPDTASVDYPADVRYATAMSLAKRTTNENFAAVMTYVNRLGEDLSAMVVKMIAQLDPKLQDSETFKNWAMNSQTLLHGLAKAA